jgi:hypothetical protein
MRGMSRPSALLAMGLLLWATCASPPEKPREPAEMTGGRGGSAAGGSAPAAGGSGGQAPIVADAANDPAPIDAPSAMPDAMPDAAPAPPDAAAAALLPSCKLIVAAADGFIASLDAGKKTTAVMPFDRRKHYLFTPEEPRPGLPLRNMTAAQQEKALALLASSLSDAGYKKAMLIRTMDNWLKANVGQLPFGSNNYFVAIYGTPSIEGSWAWHWEGHHASVHFTFAGCKLAASTPAMFGAEPAKLEAAFEDAPAGTRILGKQEDLGRSLAMMLAADPQKAAKAIATRGARMLPNTPARQAPLAPAGLPVAMMNPAEADKVKELLAEVAGNVNPELATIRLAKIQAAGFDKISFFWVGPLAASTDAVYYFRVQGPTFLFEHNTEWENHVHSAWRDFDGEFGEDLLQQHLRQYPHRSAALYQEPAAR